MKFYFFLVTVSHFYFREALHFFKLLRAPQNGVG